MMNHIMGKNKKKKKKKTSSDFKNGGILLEELITSCNGKTNPIRCFFSDQIFKATDNFSKSRVISMDEFMWYRGVIEERPVSIKIWSSHNLSRLTQACRDISVSFQMSGHMNSLKILGCCLEFDLPDLVCEYTEYGPLNSAGGISSGEVLPWKVRLKIAKEIATALTYLHTSFPEIIIHRDICPANIFIDRKWTAKLSGFGSCISIPEGKLYVEAPVTGVIGFLDPDYCDKGEVTEKVDIYSFGVVMLILLSGRAAVFNGPDETSRIWLIDHVFKVKEKGGFEEIVDKEIWNAPCADLVSIRTQVEAFLRLALRCVRYNTDDRVSGMIEVAKELKLIEKFS